MSKEKLTDEPSLFTGNGKVKEVQAGTMSMIIGVERTDKFGNQEPEEYEYPHIPKGATSEDNGWLD